jgi:small Trp-rich protein
MGLVIVGMVLLVLKLLGLGAVAGWSWWWVVLPFALAALYWQLADSAGWTQLAAMRRADDKVKRRRNERLHALGLRSNRGSQPSPLPADDSGSARPSASPFSNPRPPDIGKPPARKD